MKKSPRMTARTWCLATLVIPVMVGLAGCAGRLATKPGVYEVRTEPIALPDRSLHLTFVKPATPRNPVFLILFATGDAGWMGASGDIFRHLAEQGYYIAAFNSREMVAPEKHSGKLMDIPGAAAAVDSIIVRSRSALGLPDTMPVIVTGFSRGANLVVFTAGVKSLQHHLGGAVAIALTRETDFLQAPAAAERPPSVQVDDRGRIQTYPAIERAGTIPFAVIQSKGDKYVPAGESRSLFGPDTPTRRLYQVDARNHGFSGGEEELVRDLDDALKWIEGARGRPYAP
jgi:dienelactone hydrolase